MIQSRLELNTNAVLVHLFKRFDSEGNVYYEKVVTIACVDDEMLEPLKQEAQYIMRRLRGRELMTHSKSEMRRLKIQRQF